MVSSERCGINGCRWPDNPHTCVRHTTPCPECRCPVNAEILADARECPHGWISLDGMTLPEVKALFARTNPDFSVDPLVPYTER